MVLPEILGITEPVLHVVNLSLVHALAPVTSFVNVLGTPGCAVVVACHHIVDEVVGEIQPVGEMLKERNFSISTGIQGAGDILPDIVFQCIPDVCAAIVFPGRAERRVGVVCVHVADFLSLSIINEVAFSVVGIEGMTVHKTGNVSLIGTGISSAPRTAHIVGLGAGEVDIRSYFEPLEELCIYIGTPSDTLEF